MRVAIIDYGIGNRRSIHEAVKKIGYESIITSDPDKLNSCTKFILPGVGAFCDGMKNLNELGLTSVMETLVLKEKRPILAFCLGFQMFAKTSDEFGRTQGLGWIDAHVKKLQPNSNELRVPHVGWNDTEVIAENVLWDGIPKNTLFYYVHSFCVDCLDPGIVIARCDYGLQFAAAIQADNVFGVQFHPEKSQNQGLKLIRNFIEKA